MLKQISHIALRTKDLDRSLNFYCNILGFEEGFRLNNDKGEVSLVYLYIGERQFLEIFPNGTQEQTITSDTIGMTHLCFEVDDVYQTAENLQQKGIKLDKEIITGKSGSLQFWISDPDGNRIEIMQLLPTSLHTKAINKLTE